MYEKGKILVIEPETPVNGVKTLLKHLYEEPYWKDYEVKKIGIWFDLAYKNDKGEIIEARSEEEKQKKKSNRGHQKL